MVLAADPIIGIFRITKSSIATIDANVTTANWTPLILSAGIPINKPKITATITPPKAAKGSGKPGPSTMKKSVALILVPSADNLIRTNAATPAKLHCTSDI